MRRSLRRALFALALLPALAAVGCQGADGPRALARAGITGVKGGDVTVWVGPSVSLHPHEANAHLTAALFSPLVVTGPDTRLPAWGAAAPGAMLAEITSTDQRRWQLVLGEGWRWHDGTPVVAADLERGWRAAMAADLPLASTLADVRPVIPLWHSTVTVATVPAVEGATLDGEGRLDWTGLRRDR